MQRPWGRTEACWRSSEGACVTAEGGRRFLRELVSGPLQMLRFLCDIVKFAQNLCTSHHRSLIISRGLGTSSTMSVLCIVVTLYHLETMIRKICPHVLNIEVVIF
jgi:hypothetical protein